MKILLLDSIYFYQRWPFELYGTRTYFQMGPLSLLQLAAYFPKESNVLDGMNDKSLKPQKLAKIFQQYNSPNDIICLASHSSVGAMNTIYTLKLAKLYAPFATIIMGGYHATFFDKLWIKLGADIVIRNEAEITFSMLISKFKNREKVLESDLIGTTYSELWLKNNNTNNKLNNSEYTTNKNKKEWKDVFDLQLFQKGFKIIKMPDRAFSKNLNDFPLPLREKLDYRKNSIPIIGTGFATNIETARGCPYNCGFCSTRIMWKTTQRYKSVSKIIEEVEYCLKLNIKKIYFIDECWGINTKRDYEFLNEIKKRNLKFSWGIQIRSDTVINNQELMKLAGECGCRIAFVGFETISKKVLKNSNKNIDPSDFREVKSILNNSNILVMGYFLIGLPKETKKDRKITISSMSNFADVPFLQQYIPYFKDKYYNKENLKDSSEIRKNVPIFTMDTQHVSRHMKSKLEIKKIKQITKEMLFYNLKFFLNPYHIKELLYAKDELQKGKKIFLEHMYLNLLKSIFRFNPNHFLYFLRGK